MHVCSKKTCRSGSDTCADLALSRAVLISPASVAQSPRSVSNAVTHVLWAALHTTLSAALEHEVNVANEVVMVSATHAPVVSFTARTKQRAERDFMEKDLAG